MDEILKGVIREGTLKKLSHASFDERLSVVSLLLSGCMAGFHRVRVQELFTELLYGKMKEAGRILNGEKLSPAEIPGVLETLRKEVLEERERKKQAELLGREEERRLLRLEETLERYRMELEKLRRKTGPQPLRFSGRFLQRSGSATKSFRPPEVKCWSMPLIFWRRPLETARKWSYF